MSNRADLLLRKALQALDADERDELLRSLLLGRLSGGMPAAAGLVGAPRSAVDPERLASVFGKEIHGPTAAGVRMKVLPVRLPEAEHERLRQFCQASGFSMAVVIRALVERFLDQYPAGAGGDE